MLIAVGALKKELSEGSYLQADETPIAVQMHDGRGHNHQAGLRLSFGTEVEKARSSSLGKWWDFADGWIYGLREGGRPGLLSGR